MQFTNRGLFAGGFFLATLARGESMNNSCQTPMVFSQDNAFQISSQADADALSGCSYLHGGINVSNYTEQTLLLHGINTIEGSLIISYSDLVNVSTLDLGEIDGSLTLRDMRSLEYANFPALAKVPHLVFSNLPALQGFTSNFSASHADVFSVSITETGLSSTSDPGFDLTFPAVGNITLTGNPHLGQVEFPSLIQVTNSIDIFGNGYQNQLPGTNLSFPVLTQCGATGNLNTFNIQNINNLFTPKLTDLTTSLTLKNSSLLSIDMPLLNESVSIVIVDNSMLANISMPSLQYMKSGSFDSAPSDLIIKGNPSLEYLILPSLQLVSGNISLIGSFSSVSFPDLKNFNQDFFLDSSYPEFDCSQLDSINKKSIQSDQKFHSKKHNYTCHISAHSQTNDTATPEDFDRLSKGAIAGIAIGSSASVILVLCGCCYLLSKQENGAQRSVGGIGAEPEVEDYGLEPFPFPVAREARPPAYTENVTLRKASLAKL